MHVREVPSFTKGSGQSATQVEVVESAYVPEGHVATQRREVFDANPLVQVATQVDVEFRPNKEGLDGHVATQLPVDESANRPPEQVVAHFHARLSR